MIRFLGLTRTEKIFPFHPFWAMLYLSPGDFKPDNLMVGILSIPAERYIPVQMKPAEKNLRYI